jgi:hypothetical protein
LRLGLRQPEVDPLLDVSGQRHAGRLHRASIRAWVRRTILGSWGCLGALLHDSPGEAAAYTWLTPSPAVAGAPSVAQFECISV